MGTLNDAMTGLMDAIRNKSGVTGKLSISTAKQAVESITTGGSAADLPYRRYSGQVTETVVGSGKYVTLLTNSELAEHRNDDKLLVIVTFDIAATPYTVVQTVAWNTPEEWPFDATNIYQRVSRCGEDGARSNTTINVPPNTGAPASVGCVQITENGELRVYSNSSSKYAIRPSNYTVDVLWG